MRECVVAAISTVYVRYLDIYSIDRRVKLGQETTKEKQEFIAAHNKKGEHQ